MIHIPPASPVTPVLPVPSTEATTEATKEAINMENGHNGHGFGHGYGYGYATDWQNRFDHLSDSVHATDTRVLEQGSVTRERMTHAEGNLINNVNRVGFDTSLAVEKTAAAGQNTTQRVGDSVLVSIERSRAEVALSGQINAAKMELLAAQNFSAVTAALAACCCELKELIKSEAGAGRDLARDVEARAIRDELADLKLKSALSSVTRVAPAHS